MATPTYLQIAADLDQRITDLEQRNQQITDLEQRIAALEKRLNNGKYILKADTGNYLSRCNNCVPGASLPDSAFVHVKEADVMNTPAAQWQIILIP